MWKATRTVAWPQLVNEHFTANKDSNQSLCVSGPACLQPSHCDSWSWSAFTIHGFSDLPEQGRCHSTVGVFDCRCIKIKKIIIKKIPKNSFQLWNQNHHSNTLNEWIYTVKISQMREKTPSTGASCSRKLPRDWSLQWQLNFVFFFFTKFWRRLNHSRLFPSIHALVTATHEVSQSRRKGDFFLARQTELQSPLKRTFSAFFVTITLTKETV